MNTLSRKSPSPPPMEIIRVSKDVRTRENFRQRLERMAKDQRFRFGRRSPTFSRTWPKIARACYTTSTVARNQA
jgi:hypothetical protein